MAIPERTAKLRRLRRLVLASRKRRDRVGLRMRLAIQMEKLDERLDHLLHDVKLPAQGHQFGGRDQAGVCSELRTDPGF